MKIRKVVILGLGYIGLPTLVAISKTKKFHVVGFDTDIKKIKLLKNKISPIEDREVSQYISANKIECSDQSSILKDSDIFIICVPTPVYDDYTPDYSYVVSAAKILAPFIKKGAHIILESTVNPGTSREVILPILQEINKLKPGRDYNIAHCPERINPGDKTWNIYNIPRNIGSLTKRASREIAEFYRTFISGATINEVNSLEVAEATKIVENAFRDVNIAFVNELAKSFDAMDIDLIETLHAAANKPFGYLPHWPGCGVGGHCIAVDPYYLIEEAAKNGFNHSFLKLAREINNSMPEYTIQRLILGLNEIGKSVKNTDITLLGLSYKPNLSDTRESPAVIIHNKLLELGARVTAYDPFVKTNSPSLKHALKNAAAVVIATSHDEFKKNLPELLLKSKVKVIIDGRNFLDRQAFTKLGIVYKGIGQ